MCIASMITGDFQRQWTPGWQPNQTPWITPPITITQEQWAEYQRLKRNAEELDTKLGEPECDERDKAKWEEMMIAVLVKKGILKP